MAWEPDYAQLDDVKLWLRIPDDDTTDDTVIADAITASSRAVDEHCKRQFGLVAAPELRSYPIAYSAGGLRVVMIDDLMSLAGLVLQVDGVDVAPVRWWPQNAPQRGRPYTRVYLPAATVCTSGTADLTASWGWTAVPPTVATATKMQAARLAKRRDAPFGVAGSPELGSELRLLAKVDPDVAVTLAKYVRRGTVH
jgi:hypothetical protein